MTTLPDLTTAIFKPQRMFGPFAAQVVIEELHTDEITMTEHPVEFGAAITDHAFRRPSEVMIRMGWSNSAIAAGLSSFQGLAQLASSDLTDDLNFIITTYNKLLDLQRSLTTFSIITGKRKYANMLCRSLSVPTRMDTEHSLIVTAHCREIIIVQTQVATLPSADVQANPAQTASPANQGTKQPNLTSLSVTGVAQVGPTVNQ